MKKIYTKLLTLFSGMLISAAVYSQCLNTSQYGSATASNTAGVTVSISSCNYATEYAPISNIVSGRTYRVNASITNTWVTIRSGSYNGPVVSFAVQGTNWVAPTSGTFYAHFNANSSCGTNTSCRSTSVTTVTVPAPPPAVNPCNSIAAITCGGSSSFTLSGGSGAWSNLGGPFSTPGNEKVLSFTPTLSGSHTIAVASSEYFVDLYYKSGSCGSTGWTYVDDITGGPVSNNINLTAGTTYYFLIDDENTTATNVTISLTCPVPAPDPCSGSNISNINSCGVSSSYSLVGTTGLWNNYGGLYSTPGTEKIFRFTPTFTGNYPITVTHNNGGWVDLFYKIQAGPCGSTGWTYVDDISSSATNTVYLTAGVTYNFLLDDEDVNASNGTISIGCPCFGQAVDGTYSYNGDFSINGNTLGACNDNSIRNSEDRTYQINPCSGNYSFSTCGASWDTWLYLSDATSGAAIANNDDACGLQSTVSAYLNAGTYNITVEGYSEFSAGSFTLNVSGNGSTPTFNVVTNNVSCFGGSNGSLTAIINGNGNNYSATLNGVSGNGTWNNLSAGTYTLVTANCWGLNSQTFTISEPSAVIANSFAGSIACFGGTTLVAVSATGGTTPYNGTGNYTASAGSYSYTVTDANGCSASTSGVISQPDQLVASSSSDNIACFGGTTDVQVTAQGGTMPYTGTGNYNVPAGFYTYSVTDANGCSASTSIDVTQPTQVEINLVADEILCYGGTANVTVSGSGGTLPGYIGEGTYTVTAGTYTYSVSDAYGCTASGSISVNEPAELIVNASDDVTTYFGYDPMECSTLNATANGGTGNYTYYWMENGSPVAISNQLTACPSASSDYTVTVTDANGCTATDDVHICVVDVICFAGNSSIEKVEICHNGHTICINASAVPAHLAHGCTLGSCDEVNACNSSREQTELTENTIDVMIFPNPTHGMVILNLQSESMDPLNADVYNSLGEKVMNVNIKNGENQIDLSNQPNGIYFISAYGQNFKVIKN